MRAILKTAQNKVELLNVDSPQMAPDQIRIKVAAVGVCGSDRSAIKSATDKVVPRILGHEVSGVITEIGAQCEGLELKIGDRVTVETDAYICRTCYWCKTEQYNRCAKRTGIGTTTDGGLAEELVIRADAAHRLPDSVSLLEGSLTEPLAVAVHAVVEQSPSLAGQVVVVIGPGAVGQLIAQTCVAVGATPILVGRARHKQKLQKAHEEGIAHIFDAETNDLKQYVFELTDGLGAHTVFECSGDPSELTSGAELLSRGGRLVMVAFYPGDIPIPANNIMNREQEVLGSRGKRPSSFRTALRLMAAGLIDMGAVIDHVLPMDSVDEAFDLVANGAKVVITPNPELIDN